MAGPGTQDDGGILGAFLARAASAPDDIYATQAGGGPDVSFGALATRATALASGLRAQGLGPRDRVAVMLRNSPDALAVIWGLAMAGLVWVPVNTGQRGPGLRYQLDHSAPARIIAEADLWPEVESCGATLPAAPILREGSPPILRAGTGPCPLATLLDRPGATPPAPPDPGATMAIMYTSGTTGAPKGVPVTHRMMRHAARGVIRLTDPRPGDVFYLWEPLYHIGGAQILALPALAGLRIAMAERFSASRFWPEVAASGTTHIHYLGGILQILLKQPPCPEERDNRLRMAWGGGCPAEVFAAVRARYGFALHECYGMTEMSSLTTVSDGTTGGVVGRPLPWFTVTIRDAAGDALPTGTRGEIVVQTSDPTTFFTGYLDAPEATARTLKRGRLHTGDIGSLDGDGVLRFHGRMADSLRVRGENVSAWEVEHVITSHPDVEDCAVIGVAAEIGEQEIMAHVQPRTGAALEPAALAAWLAPRLARHQMPRYIALVDGFERTPSQRILKHRLPQDPALAWDRMPPP